MIDLYVFDKNRRLQGEISDYEGLEIERNYNSVSKIVLRVESNKETLSLLKKGNIITTVDDPSYGYFIEHFSIINELGSKVLEIFAYSLNHLLSFRVINKQQLYSGQAQEVIKQFVLNNCIQTEQNRIIEGLVIGSDNLSLEETESVSLGGNLLDHVFSICNEFDISNDILLDLENDQFKFILWQGKDRSIDQTENNRAMFSTEFDNVLTFEYFDSDIDLKNFCYVAGEGEGANKVITEVGESTGIDRREYFEDSSDINSTYTDENNVEITLSPTQYIEALKKRGTEVLSDLNTVTSYESTVDDVQYIVGRDYQVGDLVTFYDKDLNSTVNVRVNSIKIISDRTGTTYEPSFGTGKPNKLLRG